MKYKSKEDPPKTKNELTVDWDNITLNTIQSYEDEYLNIVKPIFKDMPLLIGSNSIETTPISSSIEISFPLENSKLFGTKYFLDEKKKLIHFTNIKALYSIINEGALRLYNLNNSNDSKEYSYASTHFKPLYKTYGYEEEKINDYFEKIKENAFILSTTEEKEISNSSFWQKYGDKGKGIALELEIMNEPKIWRNFFLSKVIYGEFNEFKVLSKEITDHQRKHLNNRYFLNINHIFGLYKSPLKKWKEENEIRIITYNSNHKETFRDIRYFKKKLKTVRYYKLPLYCEKKSDKEFSPTIPLLKISKIYFGPNFSLSKREIYDLKTDICNEINLSLGYKLNTWDIIET